MKIAFDASADGDELFRKCMDKMFNVNGDAIDNEGAKYRNVCFYAVENGEFLFRNLNKDWYPTGEPFAIDLDEFIVH